MHKPIQPLFPGKAAVKVFFLEESQIRDELIAITRKLFPQLDDHDIHTQTSTKNKYRVISFHLFIDNEAQLKELYQALKNHPDVTMVL